MIVAWLLRLVAAAITCHHHIVFALLNELAANERPLHSADAVGFCCVACCWGNSLECLKTCLQTLAACNLYFELKPHNFSVSATLLPKLSCGAQRECELLAWIAVWLVNVVCCVDLFFFFHPTSVCFVGGGN